MLTDKDLGKKIKPKNSGKEFEVMTVYGEVVETGKQVQIKDHNNELKWVPETHVPKIDKITVMDIETKHERILTVEEFEAMFGK